MRPDVSILLGTYNRFDHLSKAVRSIREACVEVRYEIVVCDGGSTDGSRAPLAAGPSPHITIKKKKNNAATQQG